MQPTACVVVQGGGSASPKGAKERFAGTQENCRAGAGILEGSAREEPALNVHDLSGFKAGHHQTSVAAPKTLRTDGSGAPLGLALFPLLTNGMRRGLRTCAASWLKASAVRCKLLFLAGIIVLTAPLFA